MLDSSGQNLLGYAVLARDVFAEDTDYAQTYFFHEALPPRLAEQRLHSILPDSLVHAKILLELISKTQCVGVGICAEGLALTLLRQLSGSRSDRSPSVKDTLELLARISSYVSMALRSHPRGWVLDRQTAILRPDKNTVGWQLGFVTGSLAQVYLDAATVQSTTSQ